MAEWSVQDLLILDTAYENHHFEVCVAILAFRWLGNVRETWLKCVHRLGIGASSLGLLESIAMVEKRGRYLFANNFKLFPFSRHNRTSACSISEMKTCTYTLKFPKHAQMIRTPDIRQSVLSNPA